MISVAVLKAVAVGRVGAESMSQAMDIGDEFMG